VYIVVLVVGCGAVFLLSGLELLPVFS